ncbi:uncharacterized protein LOC126590855 [Malus sylvestris]|uniref:uncharacterized protein LOC126590855 n=1 Tax=Malus sylvestris TaxID=3752 RepID=UPI0021AC650A|nr:uncharacterized protein LOC126590855 [Malus sylvestris]
MPFRSVPLTPHLTLSLCPPPMDATPSPSTTSIGIALRPAPPPLSIPIPIPIPISFSIPLSAPTSPPRMPLSAPALLPRMLILSLRNPSRLPILSFLRSFGLLPLELVLYGFNLDTLTNLLSKEDEVEYSSGELRSEAFLESKFAEEKPRPCLNLAAPSRVELACIIRSGVTGSGFLLPNGLLVPFSRRRRRVREACHENQPPDGYS